MTSSEESHPLKLDQLTLPNPIFHAQIGSTLCSNDEILLLQDGSTALEIRLPPKFQPKRIPWRLGLVRDIIWCSQFDVFLLLTRDTLHSLNPKPIIISESIKNKSFDKSSITTYQGIKSFNPENLFWRCACAETSLYITYAGYGTIVEEYSLQTSSGKLINRWTSPETCAAYEGIWCIRHHSETDQLAFTILDSHNDHWRFEVRNRKDFSKLWSIGLPISQGDVEISPLSKGDWLAIDSSGIRLIHISNQQFKAAVEYLRELRNAVTIGNLYFVIRTKNTLEIHRNK